MAKPQWGNKRMCHSCGGRFYDLNRSPIICPVCNAVHDPDRVPKARRSGSSAKEGAAVAPLHPSDGSATDVRRKMREGASDVPDNEFSDDAVTDAEDNDLAEQQDLIEDASDLGQDDDDIGEVMEHLDEGSDDKG